MAGKRKRNRPGCGGRAESKRQKISGGFNPKNPVIKSAVLAKYYPQVLTLREYLLSKLPASSKIRRRKILSVGTRRVPGGEGDALATHLDETLVGILTHRDISQEVRLQQWNTFSQRIDTSDSNVGNTSGLGGFSQVEVGRLSTLNKESIVFTNHSLTSYPDRGFRHLAVILRL
jgi:hypothetical protein